MSQELVLPRAHTGLLDKYSTPERPKVTLHRPLYQHF